MVIVAPEHVPVQVTVIVAMAMPPLLRLSVAPFPFDVTAFDVKPGGELPTGYRHGLNDCDLQIDELLRGLVRCRATNHYPGAHEDKAVDLYPPSYAFGAVEVEFLDTDAADLAPLEMEE